VVLRNDARLVPCGSHLWATHVEYSNNWNLPLQRSSPLFKLISHFTTLGYPIGLLWYQRPIV